MTQPSSENLRFMMAGYLGAAGELIKNGEVRAAKIALKVVLDALNEPTMKAPDQLRDLAKKALSDPAGNVLSIGVLERIFVDPLNTEIEYSGAKWLS